MKKIVLIALGTLALVGCGGTAKIAGGKEGAAQAFFAASSASSAGANRSASPADITGSASWKCPEGGEASLSGFSLNVNTGGGTGATVNQSFTIKYTNCGAAKSAAGVAVYNGSFTVTQSVIAGASGASVDQTFKGRIEVQGAFNDFIEADVKQSVSVTGLSSSSGAVSMKLIGTITTSEGTNTFNEDVNVMAGGQIAVAASK
ncbi:MAG: hypothetical protein GQE15_04750 [Archangiaceae bacterium]|nr:hypothetical protein [Archangiaceae bacterium]